MRYQFVIFDLDGTLLDSLEDIATAANRVLIEFSYGTHSVDAYQQFVGNGVRVLFERALPMEARNEELLDRCVVAFDRHYAGLWDATTNPCPGIPELLDELQERSVAMAVLSNKPDEFTQQCVNTLLASWNFYPVLGQRPDMPPKPDPSGLLQLIERLTLTPDECIYLGDSNVDMETAKRGGVLAVGVSWGFRPVDELRASGADAIIEHPQELIPLLEP